MTENIQRICHSVLTFLAFTVSYLILLPLFLVTIHNEKWQRLSLKLNQIWARWFFFGSLLPWRVIVEGELDPDQNYIICPNHFSLIDIPSLGLSPLTFKFVGKSSLGKIPLFGYMYNKLHITVDRTSLRDRYRAYEKAKEALQKKFNLVMYPEGGMRSTNPPNLANFKDGPFRLAIEEGIPIIPVTIPFNWMILPNDGKLLMRRHEMRIIFHSPVFTRDLNKNDIPLLKEKVYGVINTELKRHILSYENRSRHTSQDSAFGEAGI
jgi:1-acyl-sn-glycerol-3-phosphate acyltransferase